MAHESPSGHPQGMQRRQATATRAPARASTGAKADSPAPRVRPANGGTASNRATSAAATPRLRSVSLASAPAVSSPPVVVVVSATSTAAVARGYQPAPGVLAAIICGGIVALGILGLIAFIAIQRCRKRKAERLWWNLAPGKVAPGAGGPLAPGLAVSGTSTPPSYSTEKQNAADVSGDMSGDTLVEAKPLVTRADSKFKRSQSNASTKSRINGTVSPFDMTEVPPIPLSAPSRPPRPSSSYETGDRRKDTIMDFTAGYGSMDDDPIPDMPILAQEQIGQAMSAPRPSLEGERSRPFVAGGGPAAIILRGPPVLAPMRQSRPPRDLEEILDTLAGIEPSPRPSLASPVPGFAASSSGSIRRPPPPSLSGFGQTSALSGPSTVRPGFTIGDGLSPIPEGSVRSALTPDGGVFNGVGSRAAQHDGYRLKQHHMSIHSSAGDMGDYGDNSSPKAQIYGERTPMLQPDANVGVEILSPAPLTPFEHVAVLGLASVPPPTRGSSSAAAAATVLNRATVTDSLGGAFESIVASMLVDEPAARGASLARRHLDTASDAPTSGPLTLAAPPPSTFGRSVQTPILLTPTDSEFQPLSQMALATQQPDYRSPTLSVYGIFNDHDYRKSSRMSGASPSLV